MSICPFISFIVCFFVSLIVCFLSRCLCICMHVSVFCLCFIDSLSLFSSRSMQYLSPYGYLFIKSCIHFKIHQFVSLLIYIYQFKHSHTLSFPRFIHFVCKFALCLEPFYVVIYTIYQMGQDYLDIQYPTETYYFVHSLLFYYSSIISSFQS